MRSYFKVNTMVLLSTKQHTGPWKSRVLVSCIRRRHVDTFSPPLRVNWRFCRRFTMKSQQHTMAWLPSQRQVVVGNYNALFSSLNYKLDCALTWLQAGAPHCRCWSTSYVCIAVSTDGSFGLVVYRKPSLCPLPPISNNVATTMVIIYSTYNAVPWLTETCWQPATM